jgi:hypothetical protein
MSRAAMKMALDALEPASIAQLADGTYMDKDCKCSAAITALRAALAASDTPAKPYAWAVTGLRSMYFGEFAEVDAKREAKHCGGTARAFPLYTAPEVTP